MCAIQYIFFNKGCNKHNTCMFYVFIILPFRIELLYTRTKEVRENIIV